MTAVENPLKAVTRSLTVGLLLPGMFALWGGCNSERNQPPHRTEIVRGLVFEVNAKSLLEIESLTVVDNGGNTWNFNAGKFRGFTPSHLNEHRVVGVPITVTFHSENGDLVIEKISD
ncbi:hypothetical protein M1O55_00185 [Dehalococcoidia bacterium]|nr:hypothetical protein [Dehalococcoidia bacterium]